MLLLCLAGAGPALVTAQAVTWSGAGGAVNIERAGSGEVTIFLNGQPHRSRAEAGPGGALSGTLTLERDQHRWRLDAPDASGQRLFRVAGQTFPVQRATSATNATSGRSGTNVGGGEQAGPAAAVRMKRHTLTDPGMRNMPSHTVLVPEGWKVEGGAWWLMAQGAFNVLPSHEVTVTSPEGAQVELGPEIGFKHFEAHPAMGMPPQREGQTDGGYPVMPMPQGAEGWRAWLANGGLARAHPDARNVVVTEVAEVTELQPLMQQLIGPMQQQVAMENQRTRQMGLPGGGSADGRFYAVHATFERDGRRWEQLGVFGVFWLQSTFEFGRQWWWSILPGRTFTVPEGELDRHMPVVVAIADSLRPTPQWSQMKHEHAAKLSGISAAGAAKRAEITRQGMERVRKIQNETSDIIASTYDPNAGDRVQRKFLNTISEVDDYAVGDGSTVQLPSGYDHVYSNGNDEFLLTNDHLNTPDLTVWQPISAVP